MSKVWKVGLVGAGRGSAYGNLTYHDPRFDIIALCDASEAALARYQKELELPDSQCFTDYEEFISSSPLDAVILDTGKKPILDEVRAWDLTVPGLIAAESAVQDGKWLDVPSPE